MIILKWIILAMIFYICCYIGNIKSKKYIKRVEELKEMKNALNIFSTKIKFTYEPIPQIFKEISQKLNQGNISNIFKKTVNNMENLNAGQAWMESVEQNISNLSKEDIEILKTLGSLLGQVDLDGQISEIELVDNFLNTQISIAEEEKRKYTKMYKTVGVALGLTIVIILI